MGIRLDHTHDDGKECYVITSPRRAQMINCGLYMINGTIVAIGYNTYSWNWYAYNPAGEQVATFNRKFYEDCIKMSKIADIVEDDDCSVVAKYRPKLVPAQTSSPSTKAASDA